MKAGVQRFVVLFDRNSRSKLLLGVVEQASKFVLFQPARPVFHCREKHPLRVCYVVTGEDAP